MKYYAGIDLGGMSAKAGIFDTLRTIRMFWGVAAVPLFRGGPDIERIAFPLPVRHGSSV